MSTSSPFRQPALFLGHGSPMNAIEDTPYSRTWRALGGQLRAQPVPPRAILCVSAHWMTAGLGVTAMDNPRTIHDFGGFPRALFEVQYRAPGSRALAAQVAQQLAPLEVVQDQQWGLDHGAWSLLVHLYPQAELPVVQLSLDLRQPASWHYALGQRLAALREDGVLVLGSGNTVHNLRAARFGGEVAPYPQAVAFDARIRDAALSGNHAPAIDYLAAGEAAALSVPTPEHYLPLLYVLGVQQPGEPVRVVADGIQAGSLSMLSFQVG
jgi:4,5-DOPA dioxygenase extradiol